MKSVYTLESARLRASPFETSTPVLSRGCEAQPVRGVTSPRIRSLPLVGHLESRSKPFARTLFPEG